MTTQKKLNTWLPLLFAIVMIAGMSIGYTLRENTARPGSLFKKQKGTPLQQVLDLIQLKYVDSVAQDSLTDDAIQQVLSNWTPTLFIYRLLTWAKLMKTCRVISRASALSLTFSAIP